MKDDSQAAEICIRRLGLAGRFWFGGVVGRRFSPFQTFSLAH
jgi:hypothetical protein